jgi:hypothetical protein
MLQFIFPTLAANLRCFLCGCHFSLRAACHRKSRRKYRNVQPNQNQVELAVAQIKHLTEIAKNQEEK